MNKDFNKWNFLKKNIENKNIEIYCNRGEVWWCYLGINIGSESCGKNEIFERPVLILKVFNKNLLLVAPLTTKDKNLPNHIEIIVGVIKSFIMIEQIRVISSKRLSRKISRVSKIYLKNIINRFKVSI